MNDQENQREIPRPYVINQNFRNLFPDTFEGFINYITQDEHGEIFQFYQLFNNSLQTIYYNTTPEQFYHQYINFVNNLHPREQFYRNFLHNRQHETIENCIQRIYNLTRGSHADPEDNRDPRLVFVLNIWSELWRYN